MPRKTEQINIRVTPEQKREWEKSAESAGMGLAEFIRFCVDDRTGRLDDRSESSESGGGSIPENLDGRLAAIESQIEQLEDVVAKDKQLERLRGTVQNIQSTRAEAIDDRVNEVVSILGYGPENGKTLEEVRMALDRDKDGSFHIEQARSAIDHAQRRSGRVKATRIDDEVVFYLDLEID